MYKNSRILNNMFVKLMRRNIGHDLQIITRAKFFPKLELFFDEMTNALASGDGVEIRGLFSFYVKNYKSYTGRKPKTGEQVKVKPKKLPVFRVGKELKKRVDYQK